MTRLPTFEKNITELRHVNRAAHPLQVCAHPDCDSTTKLTPHHIVRRSHTIGAVDWVAIEGYVVCNVTPLCWVHHDEIEVNPARWIRWTGDCFEWLERDKDNDWWGLGMLEPHPEIL